MKGSKLIEIISTFNGHDWNRAEKLLKSPFFNENQELTDLFMILNQRRKDGMTSEIDRQELYRLQFPHRKYDDKHMRYLLSFLTGLLEDYLLQKELSEERGEYLALKHRALAGRGKYKSATHLSGVIEKEISAMQSADSFRYRFSVAMQNMELNARQQQRKVPLEFDTALDALDGYYVARKLRLACEIFNAQNILNRQYSIRMLDEVRKLADEEKFKSYPAIAVYHLILKTLTEPEKEEHFFELRSLVYETGKLFEPNEEEELYQYLKNYCIKKLNTGRTNYVNELFEIYKSSLKNSRNLKPGKLSPWEFKNIVTVGLRLREFDWVKSFIELYVRYLDHSHQKNAEIYNMANWHFHRKEYTQTLRLFQQVEFTDLYYQLDTRAILLKTYYETGASDSFFYHASAFRTFLSRNRLVSAYQKKIYRNLIRFSARLMREAGDLTKLAEVKKVITEVKQIADYRWLEEKVTEAVQLAGGGR